MCGPKIAVGSRLVPVMSHALRQIQNDGDRQAMKLAGDFHERLARFAQKTSLWTAGDAAEGKERSDFAN